MDSITIDPRVVGHIAQFLANARAYATLVNLARTCSSFNNITRPLIASYARARETSFVEGYSATRGEFYREWHDEEGKKHRYGGPAIVWRNHVCEWYWHGIPHCVARGTNGLTLPAITTVNGTRKWCVMGKYHRTDRDVNGLFAPKGTTLPAIERAPRDKTFPNAPKFKKTPYNAADRYDKRNNWKRMWYCDGKRHRSDRGADGLMLPAMERANGTREWWINGMIHRDERGKDGQTLPAIIHGDGTREWYHFGRLHRTDRDADGFLLPSMIDNWGTRTWTQCGKIYRDEQNADGVYLPAVIHKDGTREWHTPHARYTIRANAHPYKWL